MIGCGLLAGEVIPLGFEPKTHSLEGCCSNPTELRNPYGEAGAKIIFSNEICKHYQKFFLTLRLDWDK